MNPWQQRIKIITARSSPAALEFLLHITEPHIREHVILALEKIDGAIFAGDVEAAIRDAHKLHNESPDASNTATPGLRPQRGSTTS